MQREGSTCSRKTGDSQALIAVVDDEASVCNALSRLMRSAGYAAAPFLSGREFMAWAATCRPDCVILDLQMPQLDGFEICSWLQSSPQYTSVPVIIITGHDMPDTCARAIELGAHAFFRKPVDDVLLMAAINAALGT